MRHRPHTIRRVALAAALLVVGGCSGIFDVESPGKIADDDLNDPQGIAPLVTGMSYLTAELFDDLLEFTTLASLELWHGGSYDWGDVPRGIILPEDADFYWAAMHELRAAAEDGIERMQGILPPEEFEENSHVARAHFFAGIANRTLGENVCQTAIDAGPAEPNTVHFTRAEEQFTRAIEIGSAAGADDVVAASYAGRASVRAWLDDWTNAAADAAQVPDDFVYEAIFTDAGASNSLAYETHSRNEYTVFNTEFAENYGDARLVWDTLYNDDGSIAVGANGATPMFQQNKYVSQNDDVPLVKGTEMLVLRAEAALRGGDIPGMTGLLNDARAVYGMSPLAEPATEAEAWTVLQYERGATTWMEARRLWDIRRWVTIDGGAAGAAFLAAHPSFNDPANPREVCIPFSEEEINTNPNGLTDVSVTVP